MIEIDSNDKKYEGPRICPLTGGRLDSDIHWRCVSDGYVCDGVDPNKWGISMVIDIDVSWNMVI